MARLSKIIYFLLIVLLSFQAQAKNPPPGIGTNIPANVLIMLDVSGSMGATMYSSVRLWYPVDTAVDSNGNVYVMEYSYNRLAVFDDSGAFKKYIGSYGSRCNQWKYARQFDIYKKN